MSLCVDAIGRHLGEDMGRSVPGQAALGASQVVFLTQPLHPNAEPHKSTGVSGEILTFCMVLEAWKDVDKQAPE